MWRNDRQSYGTLAKVLHWLMAVLLVVLFGLGWWMTGLTYYDRWYNTSTVLHESLGVAALMLAVIRVGWALINPRPDLPAGMPGWERLAARSVHLTMYGLILAIPISGYFISTADGRPMEFLGLLSIPALLGATERGEEVAGRIHYLLAFGGAWIVLLHTLAALKHQFINRDGTLSRMLWSRSSGRQAPIR